jgi:hypothetical protein
VFPNNRDIDKQKKPFHVSKKTFQLIFCSFYYQGLLYPGNHARERAVWSFTATRTGFNLSRLDDTGIGRIDGSKILTTLAPHPYNFRLANFRYKIINFRRVFGMM